jgi:hypothetical protein
LASEEVSLTVEHPLRSFQRSTMIDWSSTSEKLTISNWTLCHKEGSRLEHLAAVLSFLTTISQISISKLTTRSILSQEKAMSISTKMRVHAR